MADTEIPYKFGRRYRGCALIIVNENFWKYEGGKKKELPKLKREGSCVDLKKMEAMFKALDFKVKLFKDLTAEDMKRKIYKASQDKDYNKKSDCFALVISSHGEEAEEKKVPYLPKEAEVWRHRVQGSDCEPLYIDDMMKYFKDDEAKGLAGKPKFFFIQACRSRHGPLPESFDYGVTITVATGNKLQNKQPSDAGDQGDGEVLNIVDGFENIQDVNADWIDPDEDEWTSDQKTDSGDANSYVDSNEDISDAKPAPDSGKLPPPPSPDKELPNPTLPSQDEQLPNPTLPSQDEQLAKPVPPLQVEQIHEDLSDSKGDPDSGIMPPSPGEDLSNPALPSPGEQRPKPVLPPQDTKTAIFPAKKPKVEGSEGTGAVRSSPEDKADIKHSPDTGIMPASPFDIIPINCPNDCVLVYPVTSGSIAFRRADLGSRLLHCMHKEENVQKLVQGCDFLQYMTYVSGDMARIEIKFEPDSKDYTPAQVQELKANMPFKVTTTVMHRLQGKVFFTPKTEKSIMSAVLKKFKKMFN